MCKFASAKGLGLHNTGNLAGGIGCMNFCQFQLVHALRSNFFLLFPSETMLLLVYSLGTHLQAEIAHHMPSHPHYRTTVGTQHIVWG